MFLTLAQLGTAQLYPTQRTCGVPLVHQQTSSGQGCTSYLPMSLRAPVRAVMRSGSRELSEKLPTLGTSPARVTRNLRPV